MDSKLVIFYGKRHILGLIGLLMALGFVGGGVILKGKASSGNEQASALLEGAIANRDKIKNSQVKPDVNNVKILGDLADEYVSFVTNAGVVLEKQPPAYMDSNDFLNYMIQTISILNNKATNNLVKIPNDLRSRSDLSFSFTFGPLMTQSEIAEDKIGELQRQLADIKEITEILVDSRVQAISMLQRNRVTSEDFRAQADPNYLDTRRVYTNQVSVIRPYKVKFHCLSGGVARVLSGLAKADTFFVVRTVEITPAVSRDLLGGGGYGGEGDGEMGMEGGQGFESGSGLGSGLGSGGMEGMGMGGASSVSSITLPQPYIDYLVRMGLTAPAATNVVNETLLEVVLDLDSVRREPVANVNGDGEASP